MCCIRSPRFPFVHDHQPGPLPHEARPDNLSALGAAELRFPAAAGLLNEPVLADAGATFAEREEHFSEKLRPQ